MKGLVAQKLVLGIFVTLILAFGIRGVVGAEDDTVPVAATFDIAISEIMYATNTDKSPQWIELHNRSGKKVSLEGWQITIENHPVDKSVLATTLAFTLDAKILDRNQVLLLVTEGGSNSGVGAAKGALHADRIAILKDLIGGTPGYRLLSQTAFKVTLKAPARTKTARKMLSDIVGNLGEIPEWELPLIVGNQRSSVIRVYESNNATGEPYDGTAAGGWEFAVQKDLQDTQGTTYYGHRSDYGTPGYRIREPLPVELSKFRPERKFEKSSSEVIIRWVTESEVNCAGFNIKRSQTRDGEFKVINPVMIPGAGTTNERQSYTYTDKTAKPNVVYYYQLECTSVDGTRQVLRMNRLRGFVDGSLHFEEAPFWWKDPK